MKRMQFIKGWRDLILLVALVQLTFMCPLCLGQNNPGAAAGSTNNTNAGNATVAGNGTVGTNTTDTNVTPTSPAVKKTFECDALNPALTGVTKEKVTKVEVTTKKTVHPTTSSATPPVSSAIDIDDKVITVKDLDKCDGITNHGGCFVTYEDGNDTKTATGKTGACTSPATGNTFECTLNSSLPAGTTNDKVTKVETTPVYTSDIVVDGTKVTVKDLPSCDVNAGDTCTVTYKDGNDTKTATGTPACKAPDAATTPTTEASTTAGTGNVTTDATTTAAATQPEGTAAATQPEAKPNTKAPTKTTKKPPPDHKGDSSRRKTSIRLFVLLLFVSLTNI